MGESVGESRVTNPQEEMTIAHFFGNYVGAARLYHLRNRVDPKSMRDLQEKFLRRLENKPFPSETQPKIDQMLEAARGDWTKIETIKDLYRKRALIWGEELSEEEERELFQGK